MCRLLFYLESPTRVVPPSGGVHPVQLFMEQTYYSDKKCKDSERKRSSPFAPKRQCDGYGFIWLNEGELSHHRSTKTYLEDPKLAKQIQKSAFVLGHLRNSTLGNDILLENNQPFMSSGGHIFAHNGFIAGFGTSSNVKKTLMREITLENIAKMGGTTDSETLFYWIESVRDNMPPNTSLVTVFKEAIRRLKTHQIEYLASIIYVDISLGQAVFLRAADMARYRNRNLPLWRNRGIGEWVISSERVSDTQQIEIPEQTVSLLNMRTGTWRTYHL